jgi:putative FmdB family regulatory protein
MATYEYKCPVDDETVIVNRGMTEPEGIYYCPLCSGEVNRVYNAAPVKFNGTGFYSTGG